MQREAAEAAEREPQVAQELKAAVDSMLASVEAPAEGDLTTRVEVCGEHAIDALGQELSSFIDDLRPCIARIDENADSLAASSEELAAVAKEMGTHTDQTTSQAHLASAAAEQIRRNVQTVATGTEEMSASIREIAKNAADAAASAPRGSRWPSAPRRRPCAPGPGTGATRELLRPGGEPPVPLLGGKVPSAAQKGPLQWKFAASGPALRSRRVVIPAPRDPLLARMSDGPLPPDTSTLTPQARPQEPGRVTGRLAALAPERLLRRRCWLRPSRPDRALSELLMRQLGFEVPEIDFALDAPLEPDCIWVCGVRSGHVPDLGQLRSGHAEAWLVLTGRDLTPTDVAVLLAAGADRVLPWPCPVPVLRAALTGWEDAGTP